MRTGPSASSSSGSDVLTYCTVLPSGVMASNPRPPRPAVICRTSRSSLSGPAPGARGSMAVTICWFPSPVHAAATRIQPHIRMRPSGRGGGGTMRRLYCSGVAANWCSDTLAFGIGF